MIKGTNEETHLSNSIKGIKINTVITAKEECHKIHNFKESREKEEVFNEGTRDSHIKTGVKGDLNMVGTDLNKVGLDQVASSNQGKMVIIKDKHNLRHHHQKLQ